jgi:hypothetical protein
MGGFWSWNPIDWVYVPVKCALLWAFVPSAETQAALGNLGAGLADKVPFSWIGDAGTWVTAAFDANGHCLHLDASVGPFGDITFLDTCTPGAVEGILMQYRTLLGVALYVGLLAPLLWWAWRTYAPGTQASA